MTLRLLNDGNYDRFLIMGNAGFISSTVVAVLDAKRARALRIQGTFRMDLGFRVKSLRVLGLRV